MSRTTRYPAHHSRYLQPIMFTADNYKGTAIPVRAWGSRDVMVVLYDDDGRARLTVNRTTMNHRTGRWTDGITWDELMDVKRQAGFGDRWAVEVYPPDDEVIDVANMRHLWLLDDNATPVYGWTKGAGDGA